MGIVLGVFVKKEVPQARVIIPASFFNTSFTEYWSHLENVLWLVCLFFFVELVLAAVLKKPYTAMRISLGVFLIPFVWAGIADDPYSYDFSSKIFVYFVFSLTGFIILFLVWIIIVLLSLGVPYLISRNVSSMEEGKLQQDTFGYSYNLKGYNDDFIDVLAERMGFDKTSVRKKSETLKLSYYVKGKLNMGILQEIENNSVKTVFSLFTIKNEEVIDYEDKQEIADYKSQARCLLEARVGDKIENVNSIAPSLQNMEVMAGGLGRKTMPSRSQIGSLYRDFPKRHPYWFSLALVVLGGVVVEIIRIVLKIPL